MLIKFTLIFYFVHFSIVFSMFGRNCQLSKVTSTVLKEERGVLTKLKSGDLDAFSQIYEHYKFQITANIIRIVKSEELAVDLVQELFVKVWVNRERIDLDRSFRSYLYTIASHLISDELRKSKRDKKVEAQLMAFSSEVYSHVEENLIRHEDLASIRLAISKLPKQCGAVFVLHKIEGKTYQQIGELLGISKSTVKGHIIRANKFLKEELKENSSKNL